MAVNLAVEKGASSLLAALPLMSMALHYTSPQHSRMLLPGAMVGSHCAHLLIVLVEHPLGWICSTLP